MSEVVEVRVHGVGGTSPEGMLGESSDSKVIRAAGTKLDGFYTRLDDPKVEGYSWGGLTSGKWAQAFWILLLPFTLLNVAGWTLPPKPEDEKRRAWRLGRYAIAALGLTLTVAYVFGAFALISKRVFFLWGLDDRITNDPLALWLGSGTILLIGVVVYMISRDRQNKFEKVEVPEQQASASSFGTSSPNLRSGLTDKYLLQDRGFWHHLAFVRTFLHLHMGVAVVALIALTIYAQSAMDPAERTLGLTVPFIWLGLIQGLLLGVVLVCSMLGYKGTPGKKIQGFFRSWRSLSLAGLGVALTGGLIAGGAMALDAVLDLENGGPELNLGVPFGLSFLVLLVALVALLLVLLLRSRSIFKRTGNEPARQKDDPGALEPTGIKRVWWLKLMRSLSDAGRHADKVLVPTAIMFVFFALVIMSAVALSGFAEGDNLAARIVETTTGDATPSGEDQAAAVTGNRTIFGFSLGSLASLGGVLSLITAVGGAIISFLLTRILIVIRKAPTSLAVRRKVGILWDVFSFFPRRFHPLAVRPYAERAVPNLLGRLEHHIQNDRHVILSTHSQGTVLAYAALQQLHAKDGETGTDCSRVSFMTYGSPLSQLHARYFPALFGGSDYGALSKFLYGANQKGSRALSWCNLYRLTDPIGKHVNFDVVEHSPPPPTDPHNVIVKDPCEDKLSSLEITDRWDGYPDPMRVPFDRLAGHSYYNHEKVLKDHLEDLRTRMAATATTIRPPSDGLEMSDVPPKDIRRQVDLREPVDKRTTETHKPPA